METATGPTSATDARKPSVRVDTPRLGFFPVVVAFDTSAMVDSRRTRTTGLDATPRLGLGTRLGQTHRWRHLAKLSGYNCTQTLWHWTTDSCITQIPEEQDITPPTCECGNAASTKHPNHKQTTMHCTHMQRVACRSGLSAKLIPYHIFKPSHDISELRVF